MLSDAEIVRRLTTIRHSSRAARYGRRITSINSIATAAGIARETVHRIINGASIGPRARAELSRSLTCDAITGARSSGHRS